MSHLSEILAIHTKGESLGTYLYKFDPLEISQSINNDDIAYQAIFIAPCFAWEEVRKVLVNAIGQYTEQISLLRPESG